MRLSVDHKPVKIYPDMKRAITRFFFNGDERAKDVIGHVMKLSEQAVFSAISPILQGFSKRHRNITHELSRNGDRLQPLLAEMGLDSDQMELHRNGALFTHEYSIESVAFFNPSMVEDPNQTELEEGEKRVIISFRAIGEGHISSIVFRQAVLDGNANIRLLPAGNYVDEAEVICDTVFTKEAFVKKACDQQIDAQVLQAVADRLGDDFDYPALRQVITDAQAALPDDTLRNEYEKVLWLADSSYDLNFSLDTDLSDGSSFPAPSLSAGALKMPGLSGLPKTTVA